MENIKQQKTLSVVALLLFLVISAAAACAFYFIGNVIVDVIAICLLSEAVFTCVGLCAVETIYNLKKRIAELENNHSN